MTREKLFSVTLKDCEVTPYKGSGAGGQKRNKTSSAIRITHPASGAQAQCENHREQILNKKEAFKRMTLTPKFRTWVANEANKLSKDLKYISEKVDQSLKNVKIERKNKDGLWEQWED